MAKAVHDDVLDAALGALSAAGRMVALGAEPADYAAAGAGRLAETAMAPADFAIADGLVSGRRATVAAKADVPVAGAGTATHVALLDDGAARLLYVTTCAPQALSAGGTVSFSAWDVEIGDPA
jgi:hypothetical protein